jgi:membrane protease YdiL (CAAX protease family)
MGKISDFIARERMYVWLLIFILVVNALLLLNRDSEFLLKEEGIRRAKDEHLKERYSLTPEKLQILLREKQEVVIAINLLILLCLVCLVMGIILNVYLAFNKAAITAPLSRRRGAITATWYFWDICKAVILFMFFGYILVAIESVVAYAVPFIGEKEHIRMLINSSILDSLVIVFILYTILVEYKSTLRAAGLSITNFFKNVYTGIIGYIAALPLIAGVMAVVVWIANTLHYEPPLEPVLKLFLEESNTLVILYAIFFVTILGPIFEEIFFRGFMYPALKRKIGMGGAILASSALFSALHTNLVGFLPIMLLGVLLAYLYERTGNLVASIIVHIIHNTGMMTFVFLMKELNV